MSHCWSFYRPLIGQNNTHLALLLVNLWICTLLVDDSDILYINCKNGKWKIDHLLIIRLIMKKLSSTYVSITPLPITIIGTRRGPPGFCLPRQGWLNEDFTQLPLCLIHHGLLSDHIHSNVFFTKQRLNMGLWSSWQLLWKRISSTKVHQEFSTPSSI